MKEKEQKNNSIIAKQYKPIIILSGTICFLLLIYAPGTIYFNNVSDFSYDFFDFIKIMFPSAIIIWTLLFFITVIIKKLSNGLFLVCISVLTAILISLFAEGNFFSKFIPVLTGAEINWSEYSSHRWISIALWVGSIAVLHILLKKKGESAFLKTVTNIGICILSFLLLSFILSGIPNGFIDKSDYVPTDNHLNEYSEEENFIIFLLDSIDGETYNNLSKDHPEYLEQFQDFTFFRNTMGVYPATEYSIPFIISGEWYENQMPLEEFRAYVFEDSSLLNSFKRDGWSVGMYEPDIPRTSDTVQKYINVTQSSGFADKIAFFKMQLMITGVKYFPFDLKHFCELSPEYIDFDSRKTIGSDNIFSGNNGEFYASLLENGIVKVPNKKFIFIHLNGAHAPFNYDADMSIVGNATYNSSVEACMTIAQKYLKALKTANVYDNSIIIIMADHGSNQEDSSFDRQNPLLMIKGKNEHHKYCINDAPISFADLQNAYIRLLNGSSAENSFDWTEGDERERRYLFYFVGSGDDVLKEMIQYGYAWDESSMALTGQKY